MRLEIEFFVKRDEIKDFQAPIQIHDGQTEQISISDHNSVSVGIKLLF